VTDRYSERPSVFLTLRRSSRTCLALREISDEFGWVTDIKVLRRCFEISD